jgi:hypothetical protein
MSKFREQSRITIGFLVLLVFGCFFVAAIPASAQGYNNWEAWQEVPGGGYTDANLAAANFGDYPYLFMKGINTHIIFNHQVYYGYGKATVGAAGAMSLEVASPMLRWLPLRLM